MIELILFIFGSCIGSFLNVCIYRLPNSKSIVYPPSACPGCGTPIRFYDNIPILSFLLLRGKCRSCHTRVSLRYPLIELMGGLFAICVYLKFGISLHALIYYILIASLIVVIFIDIDYMIIPNEITLPGIPVGFIAALFLPEITYIDSLLGISLGFGVFWIIGQVHYMIRKTEGMGGGDIKLLAMIGAFIGWKGILLTIFLSSAIGTISNIPGMLASRKFFNYKLPYGPFIAIGAIIHIFFGDKLIDWYINQL